MKNFMSVILFSFLLITPHLFAKGNERGQFSCRIFNKILALKNNPELAQTNLTSLASTFSSIDQAVALSKTYKGNAPCLEDQQTHYGSFTLTLLSTNYQGYILTTDHQLVGIKFKISKQKIDKDTVSSIELYQYPVWVKEEKVITRDGIELSTLLFSPTANFDNGFPTLFERTPYMGSKQSGQSTIYYYTQSILPLKYNAIVQAVRGSFPSAGVFEWLNKVEINDAFDTLDWYQKEINPNSPIVAYGISYSGFTALATGLSKHPSLKLVVSGSSPTSAIYDSLSNGFSAGVSVLNYVYANKEFEFDKDFQTLTTENNKIYSAIAASGNKQLYCELDDRVYSEDIAAWNEICQQFLDGSYWQNVGIYKQLSQLEVPTVFYAGVNMDQDSKDTLYSYKKAQQNLNNQKQTHLVLGDWGHDYLPEKIDGNKPSLQHYVNRYVLGDTSRTLPKTWVYSQKKQNYSETPFETIFNGNQVFDLEIANDVIQFEIDYGNLKNKTTGVFFMATKDLYINGMISFKIKIKSSENFEDARNESTYEYSNRYQQIVLNSGAKKSKYLGTDAEGKHLFELTFHLNLVNKKITAGNYIYFQINLGFSTYNLEAKQLDYLVENKTIQYEIIADQNGNVGTATLPLE